MANKRFLIALIVSALVGFCVIASRPHRCSCLWLLAARLQVGCRLAASVRFAPLNTCSFKCYDPVESEEEVKPWCQYPARGRVCTTMIDGESKNRSSEFGHRTLVDLLHTHTLQYRCITHGAKHSSAFRRTHEDRYAYR